MPRRIPAPRGFTLVEVGIAAAIIGVMAAMGYGALESLNRKTAFSNRARELTSLLQGMQLESLQRGFPVVLLIDPAVGGDPKRSGHALFVDRGPAFNPSTFDPANPGWVTVNEARANPTANVAKDIVLETQEWDKRFGLATAGLPTGFKFPAPYEILPSGDGQLMQGGLACSVCTTTGKRGYLIANPNGKWSFSGDNQEAATIVFEKKLESEKRLIAVGVVARGGLLRVEEVR